MQKVCIIIPCFNESKRLELTAFEEFVNKVQHVDLFFVNDGSNDNTQQILNTLVQAHNSRMSVLPLELNVGKAEAVRMAVLEVDINKYTHIGYWDADLATPLSDITYLLDELGTREIALGSRLKRLGAIIERKRSRHLLGRVFSTFASIILKMPVYDTQCGAKVFKVSMLDVFQEKFITRWLFDIEILARYRNKRGLQVALEQMVEVPVNSWIEKGGSKLKLSHMLKVPVELIKIYLKYNS